MGKDYRNYSKVVKTPRRPFEKERLNRELKLCGEYGLKTKKEIWRLSYTLAKTRKTARTLLTLPEEDPKRILEGSALLRRLKRLGVLDEDKDKLDYVLGLKVEDFLQRRLQNVVLKLGLARSIHHARVLIVQKHIRVGKQIVDSPSFMVRVESEGHIGLSHTSALAPNNGRKGRVLRKKAKAE